MKLKKRTNTAVLEIDFSDPKSVNEAIAFIANEGGVANTFEKGCMNKISLVKAIRTYGLLSIERHIKGMERPVSLGNAKDYVEMNMADWHRKS